MDSSYKKSGMNHQKEALLKRSLQSGINDLPHSLEHPYSKLGYSIGLTGNIEPKEHLEKYTICSCKSDEEHKTKWENYLKTHPPQPLDLETIKNRIGYEGDVNQLIDELNVLFDKPKRQKGRPQKFLNQKYQITQEDLQKLEKKAIAALCENLRIKEKDFIKFIEQNKALTDELLESMILSIFTHLKKPNLFLSYRLNRIYGLKMIRN